MTDGTCRWCRGILGVALDLGAQPPADLFPRRDDPGPDPVWPLELAVCASCGLAQLVSDPGTVEEPLGVEPQALVDQATDAVARVGAAGLLPDGVRVAEFDSPHGGSWLPLLRDAGAVDTADGADHADHADLVVDVFGLMHDADQRAAFGRRVERLADGGSLLLQYHSLHTIVRQQQWNALRHGHMAYYSTRWVVDALASLGVVAVHAWTFDLYGGTVLLQARRGGVPDRTVHDLLATDDQQALTTVAGLDPLAGAARASCDELRGWLAEHRAAGRRVVGYGAASRAVPLLTAAGVDTGLLPAVADGSAVKQGRSMPASRIPIVSPDELLAGRPDVVLVFVPDLLDEVRRALPQVEAAGGRWAVSEPRPRLVPPVELGQPNRIGRT